MEKKKKRKKARGDRGKLGGESVRSEALEQDVCRDEIPRKADEVGFTSQQDAAMSSSRTCSRLNRTWLKWNITYYTANIFNSPSCSSFTPPITSAPTSSHVFETSPINHFAGLPVRTRLLGPAWCEEAGFFVLRTLYLSRFSFSQVEYQRHVHGITIFIRRAARRLFSSGCRAVSGSFWRGTLLLHSSSDLDLPIRLLSSFWCLQSHDK